MIIKSTCEKAQREYGDMNYKGIIFDLDGTLLNTIADLGNSVNCILQQYGYPLHTEEKYKTYVGDGMRKLLERSLPQGASVDFEEMFCAFLQTYDLAYMQETKPYEGIEHLLAYLAKREIKLAVNSNKKDKYTKKLIQKFFGEIPFVEVIGEREGRDKKPSPEAALEIAEAMALPVRDILYIGDSETDIYTGKNAGMRAGGVNWGFRGQSELEEAGADYIFNEINDILSILSID